MTLTVVGGYGKKSHSKHGGALGGKRKSRRSKKSKSGGKRKSKRGSKKSRK